MKLKKDLNKKFKRKDNKINFIYKKYSIKNFRYSWKLLLIIFNNSFFSIIRQKKKNELIKTKYLLSFVLLN